tara:strand:+ start:684 stop:1064 length:381 start_codon:yes stop_codon:yes gene_type:complete
MIYTKSKALASLKPNAEWAWFDSQNNEYSGLQWLDSGTPPTDSELETEMNRLNNAEPMRLLRIERDKRLTESDWVVTKATETGGTVSDAWKTYRQSLRDLPASASPSLDSNYDLDLTSVTWPTEPS